MGSSVAVLLNNISPGHLARFILIIEKLKIKRVE